MLWYIPEICCDSLDKLCSRSAFIITSSPESYPSSVTLPSSSSSPPPSPESPKLPPNATLSQRLKHLIKNYGWYALGIYAVITVVDFSVAFAAVNILGAEHASRLASAVKEYFMAFLPSRPPEPGREEMDSAAAHTAAGGVRGIIRYAGVGVHYSQDAVHAC